MYVKKRKRLFTNDINLDSLMDILTCSFGVMLFVVIFAVLEARGVNIKMLTPLAQDPPKGSERILFVVNNGRIRFFDVQRSVDKLIGKSRVTFESVPNLVKQANEKKITDQYFSYSLEYNEWMEGNSFFGTTTRRSVSLIVKEKEAAYGDTLEQLQQGSSEFKDIIKRFDKSKSWIAFSLSEDSLDVFREARSIAIQNGFRTGWDPGFIHFPYKEVILGGGPTRGQNAPRSPFTRIN